MSAKFLIRITVCAFLFLLSACSPALAPTSAQSVPSPTLPHSFTTPRPLPPAHATTPAAGFVEATPRAPLDVGGTFVYAPGDGSVWLQNARGGEPSPLVERSTDAIAQLPAFSSDGKTVAYSALLFLPDGNVRGDIRLVDADGQHVRTLAHAEANDVVYFSPRFTHDGRLLVTRTEHLQATDERSWLEWVNVNGGMERTRGIENARDADVSPDGTRLAFVRYDVATMRSSLWLADADGTDPRKLVDDETFVGIMVPRFSPDGNWIAFGVHGAPQRNLPLAARAPDAEPSCAISFMLFCFAQTAHAHASPGALWRVNIKTEKFQQLTPIYDDSPVPAWSPDGSHIAIHDFSGIRLVDLTAREIYPLFLEDGGSGGFDWYVR